MANYTRTATAAAADLRDKSCKGSHGVALVNRLGFVHGMSSQTRMEDHDVFAWVLAELGMPSRAATAQNLQAAGEAYSVGRLMGAEMSRDYGDMAAEKRERLAKTLWPTRTILPKTMEAALNRTLMEFGQQPRDASLDDDLAALLGDDMVPADGSGPVPQWW